MSAPIPYAFIVSALRKVWMNSPARKQVKARRKLMGTDGYLCEKCKRPAKNVEIDHLVPVGSPKDSGGWEAFLGRLFCATEGLRVLCTKCHREKSAGDAATRRAVA
jgi:5-methylcytosine-specific restriction endonuclease McrA